MYICNGKLANLEAAQLVSGGIVSAYMGDKTPVDILVFYFELN
jgi:hypothetical protein